MILERNSVLAEISSMCIFILCHCIRGLIIIYATKKPRDIVSLGFVVTDVSIDYLTFLSRANLSAIDSVEVTSSPTSSKYLDAADDTVCTG